MGALEKVFLIFVKQLLGVTPWLSLDIRRNHGCPYAAYINSVTNGRTGFRMELIPWMVEQRDRKKPGFLIK